MRSEIMILYLSKWLTYHHKHLSNPQLGCKEPKRHENANNKRTHENKKVAEETRETEKAEKKLREKPREL